MHYEVRLGNDTIAFIYKPIGCHSYNVLNIKGQKVKVATIDTMLSFYLAFLYADKPYYNEFLDRILCISKFLYDVQQRNRLQQKGLLRRFSITCYGHQESLEEIRAHKAEKYKELKEKGDKEEFQKWFLNYKPDDKTSKTIKAKKTNKSDKANKTDKTIKANNEKKIDKTIKANKKTIKKNNKTKKSKNKLFDIYG
jgi:hypothetical protein